MKQRRALILYATMTKNTEKIAAWFKETFEAYQWDVKMIRLKNNMDLDAVQPDVYFDDYDVVCLGSPIVAGYPLKIISKLFSLGAHSGLEENTTANVEQGGSFQMPGPVAPGVPGGPGGPGGPDEMPQQPMKTADLEWRRSGNRGPFPGAIYQDQYKPLGIVFTTYGGGFYGSDECTATLEILKLFLQLNNVAVMGRFACCGKEFGPAGLEPGQKPMFYFNEDRTPAEIPETTTYQMADGSEFQATYFFHAKMWEKPSQRDKLKAQAFIADIVEDYFCTYNRERNMLGSQYISIS